MFHFKCSAVHSKQNATSQFRLATFQVLKSIHDNGSHSEHARIRCEGIGVRWRESHLENAAMQEWEPVLIHPMGFPKVQKS